MKKKGNILVNALFTLSLSTIAILAITRANYRMHNIQEKTYKRDIEVSYIDVTFENFSEVAKEEIEDVGGQFFAYDGEEFADYVDDWFDDIDQCTSGPHDTSSNLNWWVIFWGGGEEQGTHTYKATCTTPNNQLNYVLEVEYTTNFSYAGSRFDFWRCVIWGQQSACNRWEDPDNWNIAYTAEISNSYFES